MPYNDRPHFPDEVTILARVVELLDAAARTLWDRAQIEGPFGLTYSTAQDLHLTSDFAAGLMPPAAKGHLAAGPVAGPEDMRTALTEADALLRSVPIESLPTGTSQLLVRLADLTRQAIS